MARKSSNPSETQASLLEPLEGQPATPPPAETAGNPIAKPAALPSAQKATTSGKKRLFLVDAMGYIFRAFYAPMDRLENRGMPTKVPYLFATMMRRLLNHPDR